MNEIEKALKEQAKSPALTAVMEIVIEKAKGNAIAEENLGIAIKDGKTLQGALGELEKYAKAHKTGNCGVVLPKEAEKIICEYFEIPLEPIVLSAAVDTSGPLSLLDLI